MRMQLAIIFLLVISIGSVSSLASRPDRLDTSNFAVCETKECKEIAAYILDGLNPDEDPCNDFYNFACGRWRTTNPLPQGKENWSRFKVVDQQVEERLIDILEATGEMNVTRPVDLMREYYQDCMDLDTLDRIGIEPVDIILKKFGDWPLLGSDSGESIRWQDLDEHYRELFGTYSLFDIRVEADFADRSDNRIKINTPKFPRTDAFPLHERWTDFSEIKTYESPYMMFISEIVDVFFRYRNVSHSEVKLIEDISEMVLFEFRLFEARTDAGDIFNEKMTIEELQNHYDDSLPIVHNKTADMKWLKLIMNLFKSTNYSIDESEVIHMFEWKYITRLARLLNNTPNHVIVNYIHWNFVATMILFTNEETRRLIFDVFGEDHIKNRFTRQQECLIECRLLHVLYYEYSKKYFPQSAKEHTLEMAEEIRERVLHALVKSEWLDEATRSILLDKVRNIHMMIGYPDWYSDEALSDYYADLESGGTYFGKILNFLKFQTLINLREFRKPMTKYVWQVQPITANARYAYYYNALMFPMVIIQAHDCCNHLPRSVRYGLDGFIIAHEIFHALDPEGIKYDKKWETLDLPEDTQKQYDEKIGCLIDQANRYLLTDTDPITGDLIWIQANGTLSKAENFVDSAGIGMSFEAYREKVNENDIRLPGLEDYNNDKMFFISFATKWCRIGTTVWWKETFGASYYDEGHSPSQLRVNNPLKNFDQFAETFNCQSTDRMIGKTQCASFN